LDNFLDVSFVAAATVAIAVAVAVAVVMRAMHVKLVTGTDKTN